MSSTSIHTDTALAYPCQKRENNLQHQDDDLLEASTLYFSVMSNDEHDYWAPFQLACVLASQEQWDIAKYYLQISSKRGFWYYYNLIEENFFYPIHNSKEYQTVLAETKARYLKKAAGLEAKPFFIIPTQPPPPSGWPVIVFLHDFAHSAQLVPEKRLFYQKMGYSYIELNGTQMLSENSYRWAPTSERSTQDAVQSAIRRLAEKTKINPQRIYLMGQGQGASHAAKLLASDENSYAGGLIISPYGKMLSITHSYAKGKRIYLAYSDKQQKTDQENAQYLSKLFSKNNQVSSSHYLSNTHSINEFLQRYTYPILWMTSITGKTHMPFPYTSFSKNTNTTIQHKVKLQYRH